MYIKNTLLIACLSLFLGCGSDDTNSSGSDICPKNSIIAEYITNFKTTDVDVEGNIAVISSGSNIEAIDISNKNNLKQIMIFNGFTNAYSSKIHNNHIYTLNLGELHIIDINTSSIVKPISNYKLPSYQGIIKQWIDFKDNYMFLIGYIGNELENFRIYDMTNPTNPLLVSSLIVNFPCGGSTTYMLGVLVKDEYVYLSSETGTTKIDISNINLPFEVDKQTDGCNRKSMDIYGDFLYTANSSTIHSYDYSQGGFLIPSSYLFASSINIDMKIINGIMYIKNDKQDISLYDISNPSAMKDLNITIDVYSASGFTSDLRYLYVADEEGLKVIDSCNQ